MSESERGVQTKQLLTTAQKKTVGNIATNKRMAARKLPDAAWKHLRDACRESDCALLHLERPRIGGEIAPGYMAMIANGRMMEILAVVPREKD